MKKNLLITFSCVFFLCLITRYEAFSQDTKEGKKNTKNSSQYIVPKVYSQRKSPEQLLKDPLGNNGVLKERSIADQVIPENLIVQGSECIGLDCINGESFGFNTVRLKENNTRLKFEDTSVGSGFPQNDWELEANESPSGGTNHFAINDITGATTPFKIIAAAPSNSLFMAATGKLGFRTSTPLLDLHMNTDNTPAIRFEQNNFGGYTPQTWDIGANEANFFVRDLTGGSRLPFRIRPGAPTSSLDISASGKIGLHTASPVLDLHINANNTPAIRFEQNNSGGFTEQSWDIGGNESSFFVRDVTNSNLLPFRIRSGAPTSSVDISAKGFVGISTSTPKVSLHIDGSTFVRDTLFVKGPIMPGSIVSPSDERLKKDIKNMASMSGIISSLKPKTFYYNTEKYEDMGFSDNLQYGLIAQEVEAILPSFVSPNSFPGHTESFKTVNYIGLIPILLQGIKEQISLNEQQKAEITDLKAKLAQYEALNTRLERLEAALSLKNLNSNEEKKADKK